MEYFSKALEGILGNTAKATENATRTVSAATSAAADTVENSGRFVNTGILTADKLTAASGTTAVAAIDAATTSVDTIKSLLSDTKTATSHIYKTLNGSLEGIAPAGNSVTRMASTTIGDATRYASSLTKAITNALIFPVDKYNDHVEDMKTKQNNPDYIFKNIKVEIFNDFDKNFHKILETSTEQLNNLIKSFDDMVQLYKKNVCKITESKDWFGNVTTNEDCSAVENIIKKLTILKQYITHQKENVIKLMKNKFLGIISIQHAINATTQDDIEIKTNELNQIQTKIINEASEILAKTIAKINISINYIQTQIDIMVNDILGRDKKSEVSNEIEGGRKRRKSKRSKRSTKKTTKKSKRTRTRKPHT
jgi:hypothetical protein